MTGTYILIFIWLIIIFYFIFMFIRQNNTNILNNNINENTQYKEGIIEKINKIDKTFLNNPLDNPFSSEEYMLNQERNNVYFNKANLTPNINYENNNVDVPPFNNNLINMNTPDNIGNIYNDYYNNMENTNIYDNNYKPRNLKELEKCQVPSLNTEQCYKSRYYECPIVNGSLLQCTNNYIPKPNQYNADCGNRTFDMTPYPWKISENCYYDKIGFDRKKAFDKVKFVETK